MVVKELSRGKVEARGVQLGRTAGSLAVGYETGEAEVDCILEDRQVAQFVEQKRSIEAIMKISRRQSGVFECLKLLES